MATMNSIGTFILMEEERLLDFENSMSRVLVEMDLSKGFPYALEIIWDEGSFIHRLDY